MFWQNMLRIWGLTTGLLITRNWWREKNSITADYSENLELDLSEVVPCLAGPKRPQDKIPLSKIKNAFLKDLEEINALRNKKNSASKQHVDNKKDQ